MAIKPEYLSLSSILDKKLFAIPEYQRAYSWKTQQRKDLFEDIEKVMESTNKDKHHFMATIVCLKTNKIEELGTDELERLDIVDGQQRLTTLIILLKAIEVFLSGEDNDLCRDEADNLKKLIVKDGDRLILLQTNHISKIMFEQYLRDGTVQAESTYTTLAEQNLRDAFNECGKFVEKQGSFRNVLTLLKTVKNRLDFIFYALEDESAVYTVFEVLNSRGLAVSTLDKCKSMLMGIVYESYSPKAAQEKIYVLHDIWSKIYETIGNREIKDSEILKVTSTLKYEENLGRPMSEESAVEEFRRICTEDPEKTIEVSKWLLQVANELKLLYKNPRLNAVTDISHARMLAVGIQISSCFQDDEKKFLLDQWEKVTFLVFGLNRKDSRFRVGDYVRIARKITKGEVDCNAAIEEIKSIARELDIDKAIDNVMAEDWYDSFGDDAKYVLYRYEEYLAEKAGEDISKSLWEKIWEGNTATTIEHIHPKKYVDTWRGKFGRNQEEIDNYINRIGNLVLLPPKVNSKAATRPFVDKKNIYKEYHLLMLNEITSLDDWNKNTCDERELRILTFMKETWGS